RAAVRPQARRLSWSWVEGVSVGLVHEQHGIEPIERVFPLRGCSKWLGTVRCGQLAWWRAAEMAPHQPVAVLGDDGLLGAFPFHSQPAGAALAKPLTREGEGRLAQE